MGNENSSIKQGKDNLLSDINIPTTDNCTTDISTKDSLITIFEQNVTLQDNNELASELEGNKNIPEDDDYGPDLINLLYKEDQAEGDSCNGINDQTEPVLNADATSVEEPSSTATSERINPNTKTKPTVIGTSLHSKNAERKKKRKAGVKIFTAREIKNEKVIGEGGFGRILRGSLHNGMPVAIKFFHAPLHIKTLQKEVDALMCLKHKSIVEILGIVEQIDAIDCPQVVLQLFPEGNILQYLSRPENPEDLGTLGKFALDVIEGLQYLKHKKIVHGNLAARNVLIEKMVGKQRTYFNAKITDMGIMRFAEATGGNYVKLPGSNKVVPLRWVPKEIVQEQNDGSVGADYTFESDVWSFGVVLWEMWTRGAIPYGASYSNMRVLQFLKDGYSPLKVHRPTDCHPRIVAIMEAIFQINPGYRPTFDMLYEQFRFFKGYGLLNEQNNQLQDKILDSPREADDDNIKSKEMAFDPAAGSFPGGPQQAYLGGHTRLEKKKNKNKNRNKNKVFGSSQNKGVNVEESERETSSHLQAGTTTGAAAFSSRESSMKTVPSYSQTKKNRQYNVGPNSDDVVSLEANSSEDPTIAALLYRVNQLEREKYESRRGRGKRGPSWDRRLGPPRFNSTYYNRGRGESTTGGRGRGSISNIDGGNLQRPSMSSQIRTPSTPEPPPASQAPPPYTEEPLPQHSLAHPSTSSDYGGRSICPNGGRGRYRGSGALNNGRQDYVRKIRLLAEEIEVLRAEKMTQELLKKSAELANLMKYMTGDDTGPEGGILPAYENEHEYTLNSGSSRGIPRRRPYDSEFVYSNGYNDHYVAEDDDWHPDFSREDYHYRPHYQRHHSQNIHRQQSKRRPYYGKGPGRGRGVGKRGGGGNSSGGSMDYNGESGF